MRFLSRLLRRDKSPEHPRWRPVRGLDGVVVGAERALEPEDLESWDDSPVGRPLTERERARGYVIPSVRW